MRRKYFTKHDLVEAYSPGVKYATAQKRFERWIKASPKLGKALKKLNYKIFQRKLTVKQMHTIFNAIGPP